jgi:hypothetical protein
VEGHQAGRTVGRAAGRSILVNQKGKLDLAYLREWTEKMLPDERRDELEDWIRRYHN